MGFDADYPETIISAVCIPNVCCQLSDGCNYVDPEHEESLCALYRNSSTRLCSECIEGYSESINSEQCVQCEEYFNWPFLFLPLIMALGMSAIILITNFTEISRTVPPPSDDHGDDDSKNVENLDIDQFYPDDDHQDKPSAPAPSLKNETATLREMALAEAKSEKTKLLFASLAKIIIYYEQVKWLLLHAEG